jgi:hypothetical protein
MDEMGLAQDDVPRCLPASLSCQLPSHGPTLAKRPQDLRATRDGTVRVRPGWPLPPFRWHWDSFLSEITGLEQSWEVSHGCEAVYARHDDLTHLMRGG